MTNRELFENGVRIASKHLGVPVAKVIYEISTTIRYSAILPKENPVTILVNQVWIQTSDVANIYIKAFHEVRHYYQILLVSKSDSELSKLGLSEDFINVVKIWRKDFSSYKNDKGDFYKYATQQCEIDAENYGLNLYNKLHEDGEI